jgi:hypothetical protein
MNEFELSVDNDQSTKCPRVDATGTVYPGGIDVRGCTVEVSIRSHFWLQWAEIALQHASEARSERELELGIDRSIPDPGNSFAHALGRETKAAMISISASAHAIDAWYGAIRDLVPLPAHLRTGWTNQKPPRPARILETLKLGFSLGKAGTNWVNEFAWLFEVRDAAVHFKESDRATAAHPTGTHTSQENVTYSLEGAVRAVRFLHDVLSTSRRSPKPQHPQLVRYVALHGGTIDELTLRINVSLGLT